MDTEGLSFLTYFLSFIVLLTPLVFVHEMGHFLVARLFKVKIDVFSIGFGREIFGWYDKHGTRWKISWVPLGGYVKFFGDASAASNPSEQIEEMSKAERAGSFHHKPLWQRALVILAGPLTNFVFAALIYASFNMIYGHAYSTPTVAGVAEDSGAAEAGLVPDDLITTINGNRISTFEDVVSVMQLNQGEPLALTIERGGEQMLITVQPKNDPLTDRFGNIYPRWRIGISGTIEVVERGPLSALYHGAVSTYDKSVLLLKGVSQMIMGLRPLKDMGGPLRIAELAGQVLNQGMPAFFSLMALISINLGLVNLFPIPMLDGGHLMFYGMEAARGKPVSLRVQEAGYLVGMSLVLTLMVFVTWNDLKAFKIIESISGLF